MINKICKIQQSSIQNLNEMNTICYAKFINIHNQILGHKNNSKIFFFILLCRLRGVICCSLDVFKYKIHKVITLYTIHVPYINVSKTFKFFVWKWKKKSAIVVCSWTIITKMTSCIGLNTYTLPTYTWDHRIQTMIINKRLLTLTEKKLNFIHLCASKSYHFVRMYEVDIKGLDALRNFLLVQLVFYSLVHQLIRKKIIARQKVKINLNRKC